jgi:diguanylate cyclase (GGDEF)-like protein
MAFAMAALAGLLWWGHPDMAKAWVPSSWWSLPVLAAAFALATAFPLYIQYRREAIAYSLSELPAAMALVFLGIGPAIGARVVGGLVALLLARRSSVHKSLFNAALFALEMTVSFRVFHLIMHDERGTGTRFFFAVVVSLFVAALVDTVLVSWAISRFEGGFAVRLRAELRSTVSVIVVSSIAAAVLAAFSLHQPLLAAFGLVPILAVWALLRRHGRATQQLRDFEALHRLSSSVSRSLHRDEIAQMAIVEIQDILRSDRATVVLFEESSGVAWVAASAGPPLDDLPTRLDDPRWHAFVAGAAPVLLEPAVMSGRGISLGAKGANAIVVPVRDDEQALGLLVVCDRNGPHARFESNDALRAGAMADRLAAALRNAELHEHIEDEAWRDRLTGLANRTAFERVLGEALQAEGTASTVAVLMLGIDRFREVNETLGYHVGDEILKETTKRLLQLVDDRHTLARVAGDEFALLVVDDAPDAVATMAERLLGIALDSFRLPDAELVIDVSIGAAESQHGVSGPAGLLRKADVAMRWAKEHHTGFEMYRVEIDQRTPERLSLLADLRAALEHCHLDVHFQPKIDLVNGVVVGAEALVRWEHPTRGFVPPVDFVPLAETTGLITELTDQVLGKVTSALRLLNDIGFRLDMSLNLSTLDLLDHDLVARVERYLDQHGVPADQLTLEITETALLEDGARALETAEALQAMGAHLSIDDFGTGFSSLSYLRMLPAAELKIDRSFVTNLLSETRDEVIVRSTIDLGHNLGLRVAAEGVEDGATLERLRELGCDLAQGYGISRPMPLSRFVAWLTTSGHEVARAGVDGAWKPLSRPLDVSSGPTVGPGPRAGKPPVV